MFGTLQGRIETKLDSISDQVSDLNARVATLEATRQTADLALQQRVQSVVDTEGRIRQELHGLGDKVEVVITRHQNISQELAVQKAKAEDVKKEIGTLSTKLDQAEKEIVKLKISFAERFGLPVLVSGSVAGLIQLLSTWGGI